MTNHNTQNNDIFITNNSFDELPKNLLSNRFIDYFKELPEKYQMIMITYSALASTVIIYYAISNGYSLKTKFFSFSKPSAIGE